MNFERNLVLNRFFLRELGFADLEDLKSVLDRVPEGTAEDGQSWFYRALSARIKSGTLQDHLRDYDRRILALERDFAKARGVFRFKYFQWLALLFTEMFLDRLTDDAAVLHKQLNRFLKDEQQRGAVAAPIPEFEPEDLRRAAFFMATGSGKTLLLHAHWRQVLYYLGTGRNPAALVDRPDQRREFENILLITPNEGLSSQHLDELQLSGLDGALLVEDRGGGGLFGPKIHVIEIHKLADAPSADGVSIPLAELGEHNLVFVDEGHKGTGSEAQTWKNRQKALSKSGFLLEYSATFQQAVGSVGGAKRETLMAEYGKCILFDYSYRHFHGDGYGKDFRVLNLEQGREEHAQELLVGGLLVYYQQRQLFRDKQREFRPYEVESPLWVLLGSSVSRKAGGKADKSARAQTERTDVAKVLAFLKRFLEDRKWAVRIIGQILEGKSGFADAQTGGDLFARHLELLNNPGAAELYGEITQDVFHGAGGLEVWELVGSSGELGLRVPAPSGHAQPYFGVINIGDVASFKKHICDDRELRLETQADRFTGSLFAAIPAAGSCVNLLIGAKKFIEGWSSWRVSAMGLLNMGKGEGSQVIQLFGRGVRLRGKKGSLKRSQELPEEGPHPAGLEKLETLYVFGWNADYVRRFRDMLDNEEVLKELTVPTLPLFAPRLRLPVPRTQKGYDVKRETWTVEAENLGVVIDLTPRLSTYDGREEGGGLLGASRRLDFDSRTLPLLDLNELYLRLLQHKSARSYDHFFLPRAALPAILQRCEVRVSSQDAGDPRVLAEAAERALRAYLDRYVSRTERREESRRLEPGYLFAREQAVEYRVRTSSPELYQAIQELLAKGPAELRKTCTVKPLPRLHVDYHLYGPLLLDPESRGIENLKISPPGLLDRERKLLEGIYAFWQSHRMDPEMREREVYILRNLPRVGIGFFRQSGFFPDFVFWVRNRKTKAVHLRFLESHGMHHDGLFGPNQGKIECFKELGTLSKRSAFRKQKLTMDGFILTSTKKEDIPGAQDLTWEQLRREHCLLNEDGLDAGVLFNLHG
jgi:hypothetical protein